MPKGRKSFPLVFFKNQFLVHRNFFGEGLTFGNGKENQNYLKVGGWLTFEGRRLTVRILW